MPCPRSARPRPIAAVEAVRRGQCREQDEARADPGDARQDRRAEVEQDAAERRSERARGRALAAQRAPPLARAAAAAGAASRQRQAAAAAAGFPERSRGGVGSFSDMGFMAPAEAGEHGA